MEFRISRASEWRSYVNPLPNDKRLFFTPKHYIARFSGEKVDIGYWSIKLESLEELKQLNSDEKYGLIINFHDDYNSITIHDDYVE